MSKPKQEKANTLPKNAPQPRLCCMSLKPDFKGFGFSLHVSTSRGMREHVVSELRDGSPAQAAGLRKGDRVLSVNYVDVENENTIQVAERVRQIHDIALANVMNESNLPYTTTVLQLLVVDEKTDSYYRKRNVLVTSDSTNIKVFGTPLRKPTFETNAQ